MSKSSDHQKAVEALLAKGIKVKLSKRFSVTIRALKLGTMVEISAYAKDINPIAEGVSSMNVIGETKASAKIAARIVAIAILNSRLKINLFSKLLSRWIYWNMNAKQLHEMVIAIISQSNADFFFACTNLLGAMKVMGPSTKAETASGEQSQD